MYSSSDAVLLHSVAPKTLEADPYSDSEADPYSDSEADPGGYDTPLRL